MTFELLDLPLFKQNGWAPPVNINYLQAVLGFIFIEQSIEVYLNYRQRKYILIDSLPKELVKQVEAIDESANVSNEDDDKPEVEEMVSEKVNDVPKTLLGKLKEKFTKSQTYNLDKNTYSFASMVYGICTNLGVLLSGLSVFMWVKSKDFVGGTLNLDSNNEIIVGTVFMLAQTVFETILQLPLSLYSTFVIEARHGFNKMTLRIFFTDLVKGICINSLILLPLMAVLVKLIRWGGDQVSVLVYQILFFNGFNTFF